MRFRTPLQGVSAIGFVEQKPAGSKDDKKNAKAEEREKIDADLVAFNAAVQAGDNAKALRIGEPYGWASLGDVNQGEE